MKYFIDKLIGRLDERITSAERVVKRLESMPKGMCDKKRIARWKGKKEAYEEVAEIVISLYKLLKDEVERKKVS